MESIQRWPSTVASDNISFRVGLTSDFGTRGRGLLDAALAELLDPVPGIHCELMPDTNGFATAEVLDSYGAVIAPTIGSLQPVFKTGRGSRSLLAGVRATIAWTS